MQGIVCNTSTSPGLLLTDATAENSTGGALALKMGRKAAGGGSVRSSALLRTALLTLLDASRRKWWQSWRPAFAADQVRSGFFSGGFEASCIMSNRRFCGSQLGHSSQCGPGDSA